MEVNDVVCRWS